MPEAGDHARVVDRAPDTMVFEWILAPFAFLAGDAAQFADRALRGMVSERAVASFAFLAGDHAQITDRALNGMVLRRAITPFALLTGDHARVAARAPNPPFAFLAGVWVGRHDRRRLWSVVSFCWREDIQMLDIYARG